MEKRIRLNVGGKHFETTQDTLTSNSEYFRALLERWDNTKTDEEIFINRSGKIFEHVLCLLLDPNYNYPKKYISELDFYQITIKNNYEQPNFTEYKRLLLLQCPNFDFSIFKDLIEWFYEQVMIKYGDIQNNKFPNDETIKSSNFTDYVHGVKFLKINWVTCSLKYIKYEDTFIPEKFVNISRVLKTITSDFAKILLGLLKEKLSPLTDMYKIKQFDFKIEWYKGCANSSRSDYCSRPGGCLGHKSNYAFELSIGFATNHNKLVKHLYNGVFG